MAGLLDYLRQRGADTSAYGVLGYDPGLDLDPAAGATPQMAEYLKQRAAETAALSGAAPTDPGVGANNPFATGAAPFSFAGSPFMQQPMAPQPQPAMPPQMQPQPQQPAPVGAPARPPAAAPAIPEPDSIVPIGSGKGAYQMPVYGEPDETPQKRDPMNAKAQMQPQDSSFADHLSAGIEGLSSKGIIPSLFNGIRGFATGQTPTTQAQSQTIRALTNMGATPEEALMLASNKGALQAYLQQQYGKEKWKVVKTGQNQYGQDTYTRVNENTGEEKPFAGNANAQMTDGMEGDGPAPGDKSQKGESYLSTLPPAMATMVKAIAAGQMSPPTGYGRTKPQSMALMAAVKQYDPSYDEKDWKSRQKLSTELGASTPNSIGGILSNGKSAFEHLASLSDRAVDIGNYNGPDLPFSGLATNAVNYIGNKAGTSKQQGKLTAFNDNALKYGQEATKFYAGSGGGAEERMNALHTLNPTSASGNEMAGFLESEKSLMLGRIRQKEEQIRDVMGQTYLDSHPVMTPQLQKMLDRIDGNIAKLRGQEGGGASSGGTVDVGGKKLQWSEQ